MEIEQNKDYHLWKSFTEGNDLSFYTIYDNHFDSLIRFGRNFSRDTDFIKDCIHDTFLDLFKYRSTLSMTSNIRFYLFRSLQRKIYNHKKKTIPLLDSEYTLPVTEEQTLAYEELIIASETKEENIRTLALAMKKLTKHQREGLSLKFEHDLSYPEIAELLNVSVESARTAIYRALKTLRKCLENGPVIPILLLVLKNLKNN